MEKGRSAPVPYTLEEEAKTSLGGGVWEVEMR